MAAVARLRAPLKSVRRTSTLYCCSRIQLSTQLRIQSAKGRPLPPFARPFSTSTASFEKKYTKDHEWIELSEDGKTGTLGVSVYAAKNLGDVVFVELPTLEQEVNAGDSIGAVESVKSASDIMTPVSGKIVGANELLSEKPGTINKGPESEGWIAKIEVKDVKELDDLMGEVEYGQFTAE